MVATSMSEQRERVRPGRGEAERSRAIEVFCIHSYAGESGPPCGWRGRLAELCGCGSERELLCPRCGRATLMVIPRAAGS